MIKKDSMIGSMDVTKSERYLHTPSSFARQNLYYVQEVGKLQSLVPHRCIRENLDSFLVLLVIDGQGTLTIRGTEYALKQGDCAFLDCKEHYEHISEQENAWKLAWVHFNGNNVRAMYELFVKYNAGINVFHVEDFSELTTVIEQLMEKQEYRSVLSELHCSELLMSLMRIVISKVAKAEDVLNEVDKETMNQVREYLNEHYAVSDILKNFERDFNTSAEEFNDVFAAHFGISIAEYVSNRRFLAAKEMLRFSVKSIQEVAEEAGIQDVMVMQQMFYDKENMSADEYRSKWAQWIR